MAMASGCGFICTCPLGQVVVARVDRWTGGRGTWAGYVGPGLDIAGQSWNAARARAGPVRTAVDIRGKFPSEGRPWWVSAHGARTGSNAPRAVAWVGVAPRGDDAQREIAVGEDADGPPFAADHHAPDAPIPHPLRGDDHRGLQGHGHDLAFETLQGHESAPTRTHRPPLAGLGPSAQTLFYKGIMPERGGADPARWCKRCVCRLAGVVCAWRAHPRWTDEGGARASCGGGRRPRRWRGSRRSACSSAR